MIIQNVNLKLRSNYRKFKFTSDSNSNDEMKSFSIRFHAVFNVINVGNKLRVNYVSKKKVIAIMIKMQLNVIQIITKTRK